MNILHSSLFILHFLLHHFPSVNNHDTLVVAAYALSAHVIARSVGVNIGVCRADGGGSAGTRIQVPNAIGLGIDIPVPTSGFIGILTREGIVLVVSIVGQRIELARRLAGSVRQSLHDEVHHDIFQSVVVAVNLIECRTFLRQHEGGDLVVVASHKTQ